MRWPHLCVSSSIDTKRRHEDSSPWLQLKANEVPEFPTNAQTAQALPHIHATCDHAELAHSLLGLTYSLILGMRGGRLFPLYGVARTLIYQTDFAAPVEQRQNLVSTRPLGWERKEALQIEEEIGK